MNLTDFLSCAKITPSEIPQMFFHAPCVAANAHEKYLNEYPSDQIPIHPGVLNFLKNSQSIFKELSQAIGAVVNLENDIAKSNQRVLNQFATDCCAKFAENFFPKLKETLSQSGELQYQILRGQEPNKDLVKTVENSFKNCQDNQPIEELLKKEVMRFESSNHNLVNLFQRTQKVYCEVFQRLRNTVSFFEMQINSQIIEVGDDAHKAVYCFTARDLNKSLTEHHIAIFKIMQPDLTYDNWTKLPVPNRMLNIFQTFIFPLDGFFKNSPPPAA